MMKRTRVWVGTLVLLGAWTQVAAAEWAETFGEGKQALVDRDYRGAENYLITALDEAKGPVERRRTLLLLGETYRKTRQWAAAAPLLEEVITIHKAEGTDKSAAAASVLNKLGVVYHRMKDYDKAERAYEAALSIKRRDYHKNRASIATVVTNLAELYRKQKSWPKSERLLLEAIADKERELGPDSSSLVASLVDLALVYSNLKQFEKAKPLLERAKTLASAGGEGQKHLGTVLHNIGIVYAADSKLKEARAAYEEALRLREAELGADHPLVANTLNNLGNVLTQLGDPAAAVPLFLRAIAIREAEFGKRSREVRGTLRNYLFTLKRLGDQAKLDALRARLKALDAGK